MSRSSLIGWFGLLFWLLQGCSSKQIPRFEGPIFSLDNDRMLLRYRYDEFTVPVSHPNARGAVCFLPDDFEAFLETYIGACKEWDETHDFVTPNRFMITNGLKAP